MSTELDPTLALALQLRDSLRDASKAIDEESQMFTDDAERADRLLRMLVNERGDRGAQLVITKAEVGQLVELREALCAFCTAHKSGLQQLNAARVFEEAEEGYEALNSLITRYFGQ